MDYPCLKLDPKGLKIYGMIFQSKDLENYIKKIDEFEGNNYKRVISKVFHKNGSKLIHIYTKKNEKFF